MPGSLKMNSKINRITILLIILSIFNTYGYSDEKEKKGEFSVSLKTGYNEFNLNNVKDLYNNIIVEYKTLSIPLKKQTFFPGNYFISVDAEYYLFQSVALGINYTQSQTQAFSRYRDYSGRLFVDGSIDVFFLEIFLQKDFFINENLDLFIIPFAGKVSSTSKIIQLAEVFDLKSVTKFYFDGSGFSYGLKAGVQYTVKPFCAKLYCGLRNAEFDEIDFEISVDKNVINIGQGKLEHDFSGWLIGIGLSYIF